MLMKDQMLANPFSTTRQIIGRCFVTRSGFTLIEVLIASTIMMIVFIVSGIVLVQTIRNSDISLNKLLATKEVIETEEKLRRILSRMGPRLDEVTLTSTSVSFKVRIPFGSDGLSVDLSERIAFYTDGTLRYERMSDSVTPLATIGENLEEVRFSMPAPGIVNYSIMKSIGTVRVTFTGGVTSPNMR
ncbi:MAG: hypothetical protein DRP27_07135 [Thermotogae bacterium]|nr:MAG: hypothetical protein DRP27_07135 [Thermotogota bacterium]